MRLLRTLVLVGLALGLGACSTAERSTKAPPAAVAPDDVAAEAAHAVPEPRARPLVKHVIIFVADTLRRDRVPPTDYGRLHSPALARFAATSVVFDRAYSTSNWTKPSIGSLFTGKTPRAHGALDHEARLGDEHLLSERLDEAGFYTAGVITNGYVSRRYGFGDGWDRLIHSTDTGKSRGDYVASSVARVLRERPKDAPLFLYVHTTDPHSPYLPPIHDLRRYDALPYAGPIGFHGKPQLLDEINKGQLVLGERDQQRLIALYDGVVTYHDRQFGKIEAALARAGILDQALIIFTADHGEELFEHGRVSHGGVRLYDELVRVPMLVRWPGASPRLVETPVSLLDLLPTVYDALAMAPDTSLEGRSLLASALEPRPILLETKELAGIIHDGLKLIRGRTSGWTKLYDLRADPGEQQDISEQRPEDVARLAAMIDAREAAVPAATPSAPVELDAATAQRLRELGYVE